MSEDISIQFSHPDIPYGPLSILTGADQINWSYTLNTQRYPTYGGEVVQILSCMIDTLTAGGTCQQYSTGSYSNPGMEEIYGWFLYYLQIASQATKGTTAYDSIPITLYYPARGWSLYFQLLDLPGYALDRDISAPVWQISGKVVETGPGIETMTLNTVLAGADAVSFANIADGIDNKYPDPTTSPWSSPLTKSGNTAAQQKQLESYIDSVGKQLGNSYAKIVASWANGDTSSFLGSAPPAITENSSGSLVASDGQATTINAKTKKVKSG